MDTLYILLLLYLPLIIFFIFCIAIIRLKKTKDSGIRISFYFFSAPFPIDNLILAKLILILSLSIAVSSYYLLFNFSKLYPEEFNLIVHFNDQKGIDKMLKDFNISEINGLKIQMKADSLLTNYFDSGDHEIKEIFQFENYYTDILFNNNSAIETTGKTSFKIEKISGIHNYRISEADGILFHKKYNDKKNSTEEWSSKFTKVSSVNDLIIINSFNQLFDKIILAPKFNQSIVKNGKNETKLEHTLYGVTYIKVLPMPEYSGTIYMFKYKDNLIPIGYAKNYKE